MNGLRKLVRGGFIATKNYQIVPTTSGVLLCVNWGGFWLFAPDASTRCDD